MGARSAVATGRDTRDLAVIVPAAARGDAAAWRVLTDEFTGLLWAVARSYRLNDADAADVVQNTWLRLLNSLDRIERPRGLPLWLKTTATREALMVFRRREVSTDMADARMYYSSDLEPDLDVLLLEDERDAQLWTCFRQLSERDQRLLRLLMASNSPIYAEVGVALDMPIGSIGPTRMRALGRLRKLLVASEYPFEE